MREGGKDRGRRKEKEWRGTQRREEGKGEGGDEWAAISSCYATNLMEREIQSILSISHSVYSLNTPPQETENNLGTVNKNGSLNPQFQPPWVVGRDHTRQDMALWPV